MSKSDLGHDELQQDQLDDERSIQRPSKVIGNTNRDRDSVTPFAKDMVNNVVTGALTILDVSRKEGKPWKDVLSSVSRRPSEVSPSQDVRSVDKDSENFSQQENKIPDSFSLTGVERPAIQVMHLRVRDDVICDSGYAEQVAKIVKGLQDIQIGDSAYVLPVDGSNIGKQVKSAVRNINSLKLGNMETAQLIVRDGQGDVDVAILEAEVGPPSNANCKPQSDESKMSTCVLNKMIKELEDSNSSKINSPEHGNKKDIANWEESEEKFIRIIEGPVNERDPALLEDQKYHHPVIFDEDSMIICAENEQFMDDQEHGNRPNNRLGNYTDQEPYWCTAGLITGVVTTPQHDDVFLSKTTMTEKESRTSSFAGNIQIRRTETSIRDSLSVVEHAEEKSEAKCNESKAKRKKNKSFGRRLRNLFSRLKRSRDC